MGLVVQRPDVPYEERWYTPPVLGNELDPNPMKVYLRNPSEAEKRRLYRGLKVQADGTVIVNRADDEWVRETLELSVLKIVNYTDARGEPILTAADLFTHGHTPVIYDIATEVITATSLTKDEVGKSAALSDTTQASTNPSTGIAPSAAQRDSIANADAGQGSQQKTTGDA